MKEEAADTTPTMEVSTKVMENEFFKVEYNEKGQFAKIYDKKAERDVLKPGEAGNVIVSYEDRPHNYDAWDVIIIQKNPGISIRYLRWKYWKMVR